MNPERIADEILVQDRRLTSQADERYFFQMLRAAFEREARRAPAQNLPDAE